MKKQLLLLLTLLITNLGFAQTGSIAIVSIPAQIEAGATVDLQFTYTSDIAVDFTVQLFKTNVGALTVDYSTWQKAVKVSNLAAGTDVPITVSFTVPGNVSPSSTLTKKKYTFDLKLSVTGTTTDFGWNNSTLAHTTEIMPIVPPPTAPAPAPPSPTLEIQEHEASPPPPSTAAGWQLPHWDKGFVLVSSPDSSPMPFRLRLNHVSQFKYTNSLATHKTYTDHFGTEHEVQRRNDIQLTRDVFYFSGYAFDKRLDFNILVFTSTATLVATAAGYVGFNFSKGFALRAGYFSLPSARSMTGTYPWFHGTDRSLATNYFRPGFTQGVWANGEPIPGFNYIVMVGNSLNTLDIKSNKIDNKFAYAASIWYDRAEFGPYWNDYERHDRVALRIGTAFTFAPEDRLSDLNTAGPENNATFISDGLFLFEKGALATGVTITNAHHYLWAVDGGLKYKGFAINGELYLRYINDFKADGPLPVDHLFDWGFDSSIGYFFFKYVELFGRTSLIQGAFATAWETSLGFTWYPFKTRQIWINAELAYVRNSPYAGGYYMYSVGQTGLVVPVQFVLRF